MNGESKVYVEYLVDTTEPGSFIQKGFVWGCDVRDSEWFGPTGHFRQRLPTSRKTISAKFHHEMGEQERIT